MTPELTDVASYNETPICAMGWFTASGANSIEAFVNSAAANIDGKKRATKELQESILNMKSDLISQLKFYEKLPIFEGIGQLKNNIHTPGTHDGYVPIVRPVNKLTYKPRSYIGRYRTEALPYNYEQGYTSVDMMIEYIMSEVAPCNPYFANLNSVYMSIYAPHNMRLKSASAGDLGREWEIATINVNPNSRRCSAEHVFTEALDFPNIMVSPLDLKSEMKIESYMAMLSGQEYDIKSSKITIDEKFGKYIRRKDTSLIAGCMYPRTQFTGCPEKAKKFLSKSQENMIVYEDGNYIIRSPLDPVNYNEMQSHVFVDSN